MRFYALTLVITSLIFSGCESFVYLKDKGGATGMAGGGKPVLFDDFEKGLGGTWQYGDTANGGACNPSEASSDAHGGSKAVKCEYKSGTGTWGCGYGWTSSYMPKEGYFNATGTGGIEFWAKAPMGANFMFGVKEGSQGGGDSEVYNSAAVTGNGRWKKYYLKWDAFTRGIYSGNQSGDDTLNPGSMASIDVQLVEKQGNGVLLIDDIWFK